MKPLDFIIIGAQKSATTSLFKYLKDHPDIYIPANKEAPFFSDDTLYSQGWEHFIAQYFNQAKNFQLWGTASPQYMGDPQAAKKIAKANPNTKLIAVLRNPIDRAFSHYTMCQRREGESRTFDKAVKDSLKEENLQHYRAAPLPTHTSGYGQGQDPESNFYCVWSEYGRILTNYLNYFKREQILIIFMDELVNEPQESINTILSFLQLPMDYSPNNLGKIYHAGGNRLIIPSSIKQRIKENRIFRIFWDAMPENIKSYLNYWYEQKNVRKDKQHVGPSDLAVQVLSKHFADDLKIIETLTGRQIPWKGFDI